MVNRRLSCGCCTGGCVCRIHQDSSRGHPPRTCDAHAEIERREREIGYMQDHPTMYHPDTIARAYRELDALRQA